MVVLFTWFFQPKLHLLSSNLAHLTAVTETAPVISHTNTEKLSGCNCLAWRLRSLVFHKQTEALHYHSGARWWWLQCLGKLPSKRSLIKPTKYGLQQHSPTWYHYRVYVCVWRKQEYFAVLATGISSMKVPTSVRAAALDWAGYVKGTGVGWGKEEWEFALSVAASCYFGAAAHGLQLVVLNST